MFLRNSIDARLEALIVQLAHSRLGRLKVSMGEENSIKSRSNLRRNRDEPRMFKTMLTGLGSSDRPTFEGAGMSLECSGH
nr:hypothetical protein Iba_chr05eCG9150 [Ipomoea batatas]